MDSWIAHIAQRSDRVVAPESLAEEAVKLLPLLMNPTITITGSDGVQRPAKLDITVKNLAAPDDCTLTMVCATDDPDVRFTITAKQPKT